MDLSQHQPLISVYIPTHNRCHLLKRAIASVMTQSYQNFEILVVNDGSSDDTKDYLEGLAASDDRIRVFHQYPSGGACKARNIAIKNARGEYIAGLDDDDEYLTERLESLLSAMQDKYSFITSAFYWDYGKSRKVVGAIDTDINLEDVLSHKHATPQVLTKTAYLKEAGMFDDSFPTCQDWDAWTQLIIAKGTGRKISHPSYIIHTAHDSPRISISSKRVQGIKMFISKYQHLMTKNNKKDMKVLQTIKEGKTLSFYELFKNLTTRNFHEYAKYLLRTRLPAVASIYSVMKSK